MDFLPRVNRAEYVQDYSADAYMVERGETEFQPIQYDYCHTKGKTKQPFAKVLCPNCGTQNEIMKLHMAPRKMKIGVRPKGVNCKCGALFLPDAVHRAKVPKLRRKHQRIPKNERPLRTTKEMISSGLCDRKRLTIPYEFERLNHISIACPFGESHTIEFTAVTNDKDKLRASCRHCGAMIHQGAVYRLPENQYKEWHLRAKVAQGAL